MTGARCTSMVTDKLLALDEVLRPTLPAFFTLLDIPSRTRNGRPWTPQRRQRMLDAMRRLLLRESQIQPVLVIVENLHWIDTETQAFLDSLIDSLPTARLLLLVNYRPSSSTAGGTRAITPRSGSTLCRQRRAEELLQALLGRRRQSPAAQAAIDRADRGEPLLFGGEHPDPGRGQGLSRRAGRIACAALPSIQVPATVQAVLAARIDRLPPEDKRLLQLPPSSVRRPLRLLQAIAEGPEECSAGASLIYKPTEFLYETAALPRARLHLQARAHAGGRLSVVLQRTRQQYHQEIVRCWHFRFP